jgi:hypothetical protein
MGEILISGRYCVEEDKFPHVPCAQTSVALSSGALNRRVNPMAGKKAKACGIVLYGIVLGRVLAVPGCNANWPPIGSKAEQEALCRLPDHCGHSTPGGANHSGE